jgi:hypothetical protein
MKRCTYTTADQRCSATATHYVCTTLVQPYVWQLLSGPRLVREGEGIRVWHEGLEEFCLRHAGDVQEARNHRKGALARGSLAVLTAEEETLARL